MAASVVRLVLLDLMVAFFAGAGGMGMLGGGDAPGATED